MSLSVFPTEVLNTICLHLPDLDLLSVAGSNSTLCAISQRLLYRHISVILAAPDPGVVNTLAARPAISRYVRTFSLTLHGEHSAEFYHLLMLALAGMTELESLNLLIGPDNGWILKGCNNEVIEYPRLRHFSCSFPFDQNVTDFLQRTPNVIELELHTTTAPPSYVLPHFPSTSLPLLSHFQGPSRVAELIVPGRPLQALYLSSGVLDQSLLSRLARSTSPIILLDAITNTTLVSYLEAVANNLPSLSYLRLTTMLPFDDHPDATFFEQVSRVLNKMPELVSFDFSGMNWSSWLAHDDSLSDGKRIWQSRPPSPTFPSSDVRDEEDLFGFSEHLLAF